MAGAEVLTFTSFAVIPNDSQGELTVGQARNLVTCCALKLSTAGDKAVGFLASSACFLGFGGFCDCELHVRKLLTLWIRRVDNGCCTPLEGPDYPQILADSVKFSTNTPRSGFELDPRLCTGCELSYPQVWMKL
jgi:hypothetical protein